MKNNKGRRNERRASTAPLLADAERWGPSRNYKSRTYLVEADSAGGKRRVCVCVRERDGGQHSAKKTQTPKRSNIQKNSTTQAEHNFYYLFRSYGPVII